ncbi:MAG: Serine 3-dehydrogenase [Chlamydiae bacterium]|nr:Serine 3-dehydrogenase [Chlamydiota bacterium]
MPQRASYTKALVTGATSGLGKELASLLKQKGIEVLETGRTGTPPLDLTKREERAALLEIITHEVPDLIINSAGFGLYGSAIDLSTKEQLEMIELNCSALVEISLHSARTLIKNGKKGTLLNLSSSGAFFPFPTFNIYCASKAFVNSFSLALDTELKEKGVRVLCACPGQVATDFRNRSSKGHPQKKDRRTMPVKQAALHIWKQIEKEKTLYIFDWRTRMMLTLAKFLPRALLEKIMIQSIADRYS